MVRALSLPSCCFLRQETLLHIVSYYDTGDHNAGGWDGGKGWGVVSLWLTSIPSTEE